MSPSTLLWYFAYGSNLDRETFLKRRSMAPIAHKLCRLDGYRLCFDLPIGPGERGVANVQPDVDRHVWGVAFQLNDESCARLDRSEGVDFGAYRRHTVTVTDAAGAALQAFTYRSEHSDPARKPSERYIGLILRGAREHALPQSYIRYLEDLPTAVDERLNVG